MTGSVLNLLVIARALPIVLPERNPLVDYTLSDLIHYVYGFRLVNEEDVYLSGFHGFRRFLQASLNFLVTMHERCAKASLKNWLIELHGQSSKALTEIAVSADF